MRIPTFILSGFLGSGKTTLLLQMLEETKKRGLQPGVIMNELGRQDVDGQLISEQSEVQIERLLDGCVCCDKKAELDGALRLLLQKQPDFIFIELTGVANPEEIADILAESFRNEVENKRIITVLDAEHTLDYNSIFAADRQLVRTLRRQIEVADLILVNKKDLASSQALAKIEKVVRKQNEHAEILYTVHSEINVASLLEGITPHKNLTNPAEEFTNTPIPEPSYSHIKSITLPIPEAISFNKAELEQFLRHWCPQLVRMKGYIRIEEKVELFQFAGGRMNWTTSVYPGTPYLVVIGMQLDKNQMLAEWTAFCESMNVTMKSS